MLSRASWCSVESGMEVTLENQVDCLDQVIVMGCSTGGESVHGLLQAV